MKNSYPNGSVRHFRLGEVEPGVRLHLDTYYWPPTSLCGIFAESERTIADPTIGDGDFSITGQGYLGRLSFCVTKADMTPDRYDHYRKIFDEWTTHNVAHITRR